LTVARAGASRYRRVVRPPVAVAAVAAVALLGLPAAARPSLSPLPIELLRAYAPLCAHAELALLESDGAGHATQTTIVAFAAAPPEKVHEVVAHPEAWPTFLRNVSRSEVHARPDGSIENTWRVELPIGHVDGAQELRFEPGPAGAIDGRALGPGKEGVLRWEFLPVDGGGTLMVFYAHQDPLRDVPLLGRMLRRNPAYESGMSLAAGLVLVKGVQAEATRRAAGMHARAPSPGRAPGFSPLLARGMVAVIREDDAGALVDVSVVERVAAPPSLMREIAASPETWPSFFSSVTHADVLRRDAAGIEYTMGVSAILLDVESTYRMNLVPGGVDTLAVGGDLRGARYRFDFAPADGGGTVAVYRGNSHLGGSSRILRAMFRFEPSFDHSANVGVGIIAMRAIAARAAELLHRH
jgi:hypothetical protein